MKLELRKAYDTVESGFIREIMIDLEFPTHFVNLIMTCLTTTQHSILINGVLTDLIQPWRGLTKGDPLSPLWSTLYMEYFTRAMVAVSEHPNFSYHPRCRRVALIKKINAICRTFLWHGNYDDISPGSVARDKLCWPKIQGGLGFTNLMIWNQAAVRKLAWPIDQKKTTYG